MNGQLATQQQNVWVCAMTNGRGLFCDLSSRWGLCCYLWLLVLLEDVQEEPEVWAATWDHVCVQGPHVHESMPIPMACTAKWAMVGTWPGLLPRTT